MDDRPEQSNTGDQTPSLKQQIFSGVREPDIWTQILKFAQLFEVHKIFYGFPFYP